MYWYLKLLIIGIATLITFLIAAPNPDKRSYIAYLLIALFAQTGFAYEIKPGYHTSAAELIYFAFLIFFFIQRVDIQDHGLQKPIKWYLVVAVLGIFPAIIHDVSPLNTAIEIKSYVLYIFYLYLVPFLIRNKTELKNCLWVFIIFSVIPLVYVVPNLGSLADIETERIADFTQYWGALNILVGYILPVIFMGITLIYLTSNPFIRVMLLMFVGVSFVILFYSQTRSGWCSFLISFIVFANLARKKYLVFVVIPLLSIIIALSSLAPNIKTIIRHRVFEQTIDQQDSSFQKRLDRWETAIDTFKALPLLGSGWGGYLVRRPSGYMSDVSLSILPRWHNSFFEIISQLGLLGVLTFYWIWLRLGKLAMQARALIEGNKDNILLSGMIAAVLSCFIYSFGEQQFYKIETASVSWFVAGLLVACLNIVTVKAHEKLPETAEA